MQNPPFEDVARRAYELFISRGAEHGRDLDDWLEAERELGTNGKPSGRARTSSSTGHSVKPAARRKSH
jgi:hypothetical protein